MNVRLEPVDANVDLSHEFSWLEICRARHIQAARQGSIIGSVSPLSLSGQEAKPTFGSASVF
jgi:hypothetical protein